MRSRTSDPHDTARPGTDDPRRSARGLLPTRPGARERATRIAAQRRAGPGWAILVVVVCTALSACASAKPEFVVDDFSARAPRVLAVMPVDGVVFDPGNDPNIVKTIVELLERRGYTVRHVIDGPQGVDQARKRVDDYESGDW